MRNRVLIAAVISGLADADAIAIFIARNVGLAGEIGIIAIIIGAIVNTLVKIVVAKLFGSKEFGNNFMKMLAPVVIVGIIIILLL